MSDTNQHWWDEMLCYHPAIFQKLAPALRQETEQDIALIPACPCCGEGRTLHCYFKKETNLVIPSSFKNWCRECREKLARQADDFRASLRNNP